MEIAQSDGGAERLRQQRGVVQSGQLDQPAPIDIVADVSPGQLLRQARLADAARTDHGQQGRADEQRIQLVQLAFAPDKAGQDPRQVVAGAVERAARCGQGWFVDAADARPATSVDHRLEGIALGADQAQRARQQGDRVTARDVRVAAFEAANTARAHAGAFGKLLLRQADCAPMIAQHLAEAGRRIAGRHGGHCRRCSLRPGKIRGPGAAARPSGTRC